MKKHTAVIIDDQDHIREDLQSIISNQYQR